MAERKKNEMNQSVIQMEELEKMAQVDIRTVDRNELVDIADVTIDTSLPVKKRIQSYIQQVKNPYCFLSHGVVVKVGFAGKTTLQDCLNRSVSME